MRCFWAYYDKSIRLLGGSSGGEVSNKVSGEVSGKVSGEVSGKVSSEVSGYN